MRQNGKSSTFPFGRPARVTPPVAHPARLFILGAYPSALHIRWTPPSPYERVRALAVDVEPHAFWNGADQVERVEAWKRTVGWRADWGSAEAAGELNGSSGAWVDEHILRPLGGSRDAAWITDCLHWYCASKGGARRIADTYAPFAIEHGLPEAVLPAHPSEAAIVREAASEHARLREELLAAAPERVVTLGNAALRVLRELVDGELPKKLSADRGYGDPIVVRFEGRELEVLPLAHPAAPKMYKEAHGEWAKRRLRGMRTPPNVPDLIAAETRILTERLRGARAALPMHQYEKGAALERVARQFLRSFLPAEYGLATGFVVWREPTESPSGPRFRLRTSGQLDIIIYDALRGAPIADVGSAQVFPIENVFGYVEVKATFRESVDAILRQSKELRDVNDRYFFGQRPPGMLPSVSEFVEGLEVPDDDWHEWNRTRSIHVDARQFPEVRPLSFVFAFDYERDSPSTRRSAQAIVEHFTGAWREVGHLAHIYGALLGESGFLRCIPDHSGKRPFTAAVEPDDAAATFKRMMMIELSRRYRMPAGVSIDYDGYWSEAHRS